MDSPAMPVIHCPAALRRSRRPHLPQGCRCLIDSGPTRQAIRSLAAIGWPLGTQGRLVGWQSGALVGQILRRDTVTRHTAHRFAALWDRVWDVPGPSPRTVATATRLEWNAPDPVVVARLVAGIPCPRGTLDRDQAIRVLLAQSQLSPTAIANRVHTAERTVRAIAHQYAQTAAPASHPAVLARLAS